MQAPHLSVEEEEEGNSWKGNNEEEGEVHFTQLLKTVDPRLRELTPLTKGGFTQP